MVVKYMTAKVYKILFVINTLGQAGAETALLSLLQTLAREKGEARYEISLYVLTGQGEMASRLPEDVRLLNKEYREESVLTAKGRKYLKKTVLKAMFTRGTVVKLFPYLVKNTCAMLGKKRLLPDKLLWRVLSDGGIAGGIRFGGVLSGGRSGLFRGGSCKGGEESGFYPCGL